MEEQKSEVLQLLEDWEAKGFTCRFMPKDGMLLCIESQKILDPERMDVISIHRYEGTKDLNDQSVIYVITNRGDTKGMIIDSYGAYADADLAECILKLNMTNETSFMRERPLVDELK
jgi:hypothetical protein